MTTKAGSGGEAGSERRSKPRAARLGRAVLNFNSSGSYEYEVANVSAGGALLIGGPQLRKGRSVRVLLMLTGLASIAVDAHVIRSRDDDGTVAVRFDALDVGLEDLIQEVVLSALSGRHLRALPMDFAMQYEALPLDDAAPPEEVVPSSWPGFALPREARGVARDQLTDG
jgi:hypothetical protein